MAALTSSIPVAMAAAGEGSHSSGCSVFARNVIQEPHFQPHPESRKDRSAAASARRVKHVRFAAEDRLFTVHVENGFSDELQALRIAGRDWLHAQMERQMFEQRIHGFEPVFAHSAKVRCDCLQNRAAARIQACWRGYIIRSQGCLKWRNRGVAVDVPHLQPSPVVPEAEGASFDDWRSNHMLFDHINLKQPTEQGRMPCRQLKFRSGCHKGRERRSSACAAENFADGCDDFYDDEFQSCDDFYVDWDI